MKKITVLWIAALAVMAYMPAASPEDTVESVQKAVTEQWDKLKSMTSGFDLVVQVKLNPEMATPLKVIGGGTIQYAKKAETACYKVYAWAGLNETSKMGQAQEVSDGKDTYRDVSAPLFKVNEAGKIEAASAVVPGGKALFDLLQQHLNLTVAPGEKAGDKDCYALSGTLKEPSEDIPVSAVKVLFAKDTGILMKVVATDAQGAEIGVITIKDIQPDVAIGDDAFVYVPLVPPTPPAPAAPAGDAKPAEPGAAPAPAKPAEPAKDTAPKK